MITRELCIQIYNCHSEILKTEEFIKELESKTIKDIVDDLPFYLKNRDAERGYLTLGFTVGNGSKSLCAVAPDLALRIAIQHLTRLRLQLIDLNAQATLEAKND